MSTHQLFFHLVWTTRSRLPMIDADVARFLDAYFRKVLVRGRAELVGIAILRTHVHMVIRTGPYFDLPRLVQGLKGGSSYEATRQPGNRVGLRWAKEYSATTISPKQLPAVMSYLARQGEHHPGEAL
jgi:putative transposase